jgi:hypothetical protein
MNNKFQMTGQGFKSALKISATALLIFLTMHASAQNFIVKRNGEKDSANVATFDIFSLKKIEPRVNKDADKVVTKYDTSSLRAFQISGYNFYRSKIHDDTTTSHAFLPTDDSVRNLRIRSAQIDMKKYNLKGFTYYQIALAPNGYSAWMGSLGIGDAIAGAYIDKKKHKRSSEQMVLLLQKGDSTIQDVTTRDWFYHKNNKCWEYLKENFSDNPAIVAALDKFIKDKKQPTFKIVNTVILSYLNPPQQQMKEVRIMLSGFDYYKYRFLNILSFPTNKLKENVNPHL